MVEFLDILSMREHSITACLIVMFKGKKGICFTLVGIILFSIASCDDKENPTGPGSLSSNVAGTWSFSGTLTSNTCEYLQGVSGFEMGSPVTQTIRVTQTGANLQASPTGGNVFGRLSTFLGTVNGNAVSLAESNPSVLDAGGCSAANGGGMDIQRTTDNAGSGTVNLATVQVGGNCAMLGVLPCAVVYTGNWARTSSTKIEGSQSSAENAVIEQMQQIMKR